MRRTAPAGDNQRSAFHFAHGVLTGKSEHLAPGNVNRNSNTSGVSTSNYPVGRTAATNPFPLLALQALRCRAHESAPATRGATRATLLPLIPFARYLILDRSRRCGTGLAISSIPHPPFVDRCQVIADQAPLRRLPVPMIRYVVGPSTFTIAIQRRTAGR
jgi:hypothetical protein